MQVSWIDETDMSALLGSLRGPMKPAPAEEELTSDGTLFDEPDIPAPARKVEPAVVVVAETHPDLNDFRTRLQAIRDRAVNAGLLSRAEAPPPPLEDEYVDELPEPVAEEVTAEEMPDEQVSVAWPVFKPFGNTVAERLSSFVAWAQPCLDGAELFIIDDQGDVLWGQAQHRGLVLSTIMAWVASSRMSAVFAFERAPLLRQSVASGGYLLAIPCPTRLGLLHLAIISDQALPDEYLPDLRQALITAMEVMG
jgi:hypothetical protein